MRLAAIDVEQLVGEIAEMIAIAFRDTHHLRDDPHRERGGQIAVDIHVALVLNLVQELRDRRAHERPPCLHGAGREELVHDRAHVGVCGAVLLDELVAAERADPMEEVEVVGVDRRVWGAFVRANDCGREGLVVPEHPHHVLVARDHPELVGRVPVHRILFAEAGEERIRVSDDIRREQRVEVDGGQSLVQVGPAIAVRAPWAEMAIAGIRQYYRTPRPTTS